jgi:hypothetical protein
MKKRVVFTLLLTFALLSGKVGAQQVFLETFESGIKPSGWTEEKVRGGSLISWIYQGGGGIGDERWGVYPDTAAAGNFNAVFGYQSANSEATKLITPRINLFGRSKPELRFWHVQQAWTWYDQSYVDQLKVFYKLGKDKPWNLMESYTVAVEAWTERILQIPNIATLGDSVFFGFEGTTKYGNGTCIDNVKIIETQVTPRTVSSLSVKQASTRFVASGLQNNAILRVDVNVVGNEGTCLLESLTVKTNNSSNSDIALSGVKLYYTPDTFFNATEPLAAGQTISGDQAVFSGINKDLSFGHNSIWLTYDIADLAMEGHTVDMYFAANGIRVDGANYPSSQADPSGTRPIFNKIYYDGFESALNWTLQGDFQWDSPKGLGGLLEFSGTTGGTPDPDQAFNGAKIIGNDLNGLGDYHGNYEINVSAGFINYATSPSLDLRYYKDVNLTFQRWLNVYQYDFASIDVSLDDGLSWNPIWTNINEGGTINDSKWEIIERNISAYVQRKNHVKLRYTLGPTADIRSYCGWNIDDILLVGDFITRDVGVTRIMTPSDGCGLSSSEPVKIVVKNFGYTQLTDPIPVRYSFNGGINWVDETITHDPLNTGDSIIYTFTQKKDLTIPNVYDQVFATTNLAGDEEAGNNLADTMVYSLPYSSLPYHDDFEQPISFWKAYGKNSTWAHGKPNSIKLTSAFAGEKAWKTNLTNYHLDEDSSYVESPCFNFTGIEKPIFEFKMWRETEKGSDGVRLEYSLNNGSSWAIVPKHTQPYTNWNWYNNTSITALNSAGWDSASIGWLTAKQFLPPALANQANVKFRFHFESDTITTFEGFAFDEVKVFEAPTDIGATSFKNLINNCQYLNSNLIGFYFRNFGHVKVNSGTKIIAGLKVNNNAVIIDTITLSANLAVGDSALFQFTKATNLNNPGIYSVKVWTMNEPDPLFYHPLPNDTARKQIEVYSLPTIGLKDTLRSSRPDTLILTAKPDANYDYFWLNNGSTSNILSVPGKGKFIIRVTDTRGLGCQTYDTTVVVKLVLDVGVDSVLNPHNACELGNAVHPAVRIRNFGTDTLEVGDTIPVSFKLGDDPLVKRNYRLSQRLFPLTTTFFTFDDAAVDMTDEETYDLNFSTWFKYDSTAANNSMAKTVEVYGYPSVSIGPDTLIAGLTYQLDAGPGYKSYLWNNGETTQKYLARYIGNHWVTITDEHDCPASDTAFIHLVIHDIGIAEVIQPLSACNPAGMQKITVVVENMGTDTLSAGLEIPLGYSLKGNAWVRDTVILPGDLYPEAQILNTFDATENFSSLGNYNLEVFAHIQGDINSANDTLADTVSFWGNPSVNLGNDGVYKQISHLLDAGTGPNYTYLWNTGDTTQTISVTNTGNYSVTLTDTHHGCYDQDTILITLLIDDMGILAHDPDTIFCTAAFKGIGLTLKNYGNLNYTVNKKIPVMYRLNGGALRGDTAVVAGLLTPGGTINFTIDNFLSVPPIGENTLIAFTKLTGDLRSGNDTLIIRFVVNENPTIDLSSEDTIHYATIPYQLDAGSGYSAYSWNTGSNGQFVNISSDGWYRVTVADAGGCTATDSVFMFFFNSIGYKEGVVGKYMFFPNPAGDFLRIQVETKEGEITLLEMINPLGQVVFNRSIAGNQRYDGVVDTRNYSRGIYLMRLRNSQGSRIEKIILE